MGDAPLRYVVERRHWHFLNRGEFAVGQSLSVWQGYVSGPGSTRLRSFPDYEEARRFWTECEKEVRARANPFACGGPALHYQTSFDEGRLHDWLLDGRVEPPPADKDGCRDWRSWWDGVAPGLSAEQRAHCWEAFDRVRFHDLVERPGRPVVYVVVERYWQYNDNWYECCPEGGTPLQAYTTWEKAEEVRARSEASRERHGLREITARIRCQTPPFQPLPEGDVFDDQGENLFFEVIEVELEG
jgi:hypothetical protein